MTLRERVAVITGASRGLGREIARLFARKGARLVLVARGEAALRQAAEELSGITTVLTVATDVGEEAERITAMAVDRFGRVDVLINNASEIGPSPMPSLEDYPWDALLRVFRINVVAPLHLSQLLLPQMKARREGVIINVTSDAGVQAYPGWGGYGASKAALEHLSRTLAAELEGSGIRVYVVDPGDMNTEMHRQAEPGIDLSGLPGPDVPAPAFVHLVEEETAPFGRFEALALLGAPHAQTR
ncbi:MAG TPA: SDR family oxidoreductase [bacterium]|jgi:NAD(P)-dependent dehydrogenase (short-subunit alcohol dehydrogenase family)|nr:SDR family oxidoreductase [bacterium]